MRKLPQLTGGRTGEGSGSRVGAEGEHRDRERREERKVMGGRDVKTARVPPELL